MHAPKEVQAQIDAALADLAADIAHEVNQPLTAISNYALACERMLSGPDPAIAEVREALKQIAAQALRAGDGIRRVRDSLNTQKRTTP